MSNGIKESYLMWVGAQDYPTIKAFEDEAEAQGISKRLPNEEMGKTLLQPGNVIFLAHDEGNYSECPKCTGLVECGDCRKRNEEVKRLQAEVEALREEYKSAKEDKERQSAKRKGERRNEKIQALKDANKTCAVCEGKGSYTGGTGGSIRIDGRLVDYRQYNYWLHQPKKWKPEDHNLTDHTQCEHCGGTGRMPEGKVFGLFLPEGVDYILKDSDTDKVKHEMESKGFDTVDSTTLVREVKRGCGKRKQGGYYVVTRQGNKPNQTAQEVVDRLVKAGVVNPDGVEVKGSYVNFVNPIDINVKRFRGLKRWNLDPRAEQEAEMILDALED